MTKDKKGTKEVKEAPVVTKERKKASWSISDEGLLSVVHPKGMNGSWDMKEIYPTWANLTKPMQHVCQYGAKQLLSDSIAGVKEPKVEMLNEKWKEILEGKVRTGVTSLKNKLKVAAQADEELARLLAKAGITL